ncbi:MAG: protein-export chaperone SecB [Prevotella sp.]|jgi:preprotein translocase subunit SecB|nr:protein-export chaperone SecB [Prevotella sp.]MCH4183322.1 protein-export chaperone SecB [Prevotella sp.]MCH4242110.1 protein-export chaperone SecB [Prevotella sp.]
MEIKDQTKLSFLGVDITDLQFHSQRPRGKQMEIRTNFSPIAILSPNHKNVFSIVLDCELESKNYFVLSFKALGRFIASNDIDEKSKKAFINSNAVAIMFPYIRSFIATFTSNIGNSTGTLNIPTQFFKGSLPIIDPSKKQ